MKRSESHCACPPVIWRKATKWPWQSSEFNWSLRIITLAFAMTMLMVSSSAFAGEIQQFEQKLDSKKESTSVETPKKKKTVDQEPEKKGVSEKLSETLGWGVAQTLMGIFLAGAFEMAGEDDLGYVYRHLKEVESPALPTFKLDGNYQYLAGNDNAASARVEIGYLMVGAEGEYKRFWESAPHGELNVASGHILLRALFSDVFQMNIAGGEKIIWGSTKHEGVEVGFPFYIIFGKHFIWDIKPYLAFIGGNDVYDISSGISYKYKLIGARAAYRGISIGDETLHGPEVGLFLQW
ncbi:MAG: hypothetical protein HYU98_04535 [Deltaproteobacteria bacterium]|nr:hypothetical protein [Deltaproteobacteria bacterium]